MAKSQPDPFIDSVRGQKVVDDPLVAAVNRVPGAAVLTEQDAKNLKQLEKEEKNHVDTTDNPASHPRENQDGGVAVQSVTANVASRSNIVADGPGTCETAILQEGNDPAPFRPGYGA